MEAITRFLDWFLNRKQKCKYCGSIRLGSLWGWFPNCKLRIYKEDDPVNYSTYKAEHEWYSCVLCIDCYRFNEWAPDPYHIKNYDGIGDLKEYWKDIKVPTLPLVIYDKDGVPVFATDVSSKMYLQWYK